MKKAKTLFLAFIGILSITSCQSSGKQYQTLKDLYDWVDLINGQTLKSVEIEDGISGVDPSIYVPTIRYSEKLEDIAYNLDILHNQSLIKVQFPEARGGSTYRTARYTLFDGNLYELHFSNEYIYSNNPSPINCFKLAKYPDIISNYLKK